MSSRAARVLWLAGCCFALLAVAAGAFGSHALRDRLTTGRLAAFETGARYQMYHALALLAVALLADRAPAAARAGWLFIVGIVLFSGSLYLLALTGVWGFGVLTPLGGVAFIVGWVLLATAGWRMHAAGIVNYEGRTVSPKGDAEISL